MEPLVAAAAICVLLSGRMFWGPFWSQILPCLADHLCLGLHQVCRGPRHVQRRP